MSLNISEHFTLGKLLRFTAPTAVMMVFTSIYGVIDGLFVSNFVSKEAFSALNLIYPFIMMIGALGMMFGTGGTALVAKTLGEGKKERANGLFSLIIYTILAVGVVSAVLGIIFMRPVGQLFKATGSLLDLAVLYGTICAIAMPAFMLQQAFQSFLPAAGKPKVGLAVIIGAGVTNIVLDALFIIVFGWGLAGAAIATAISQVIGGGLPLLYFARKNPSNLRLGKPVVDLRALGKACTNGASELVANLSMSLVSMLYNYQLMTFIGADGVAAYGVIQYVIWIFVSFVMGFSMGSAPLVSYQYGAQNKAELTSLFKKSVSVVAALNVILTVLAVSLARPIAMLFVGYDEGVLELTVQALSIYSFMLLMAGFSIYGSAFFTALNNGLVSAVISFVRTLVFECGAVIVLPVIMGEMGIWYAILVAEAMSVLLTCGFLAGLRKNYGYLQ